MEKLMHNRIAHQIRRLTLQGIAIEKNLCPVAARDCIIKRNSESYTGLAYINRAIEVKIDIRL